MRILWFVNSPIRAINGFLGQAAYLDSGSWMEATIDEIVKCKNLKLGVVWASDSIRKYEKFEKDNIEYYLIPVHPLPRRKGNKLNRIRSHAKRIVNLIYPHKYNDELRYCMHAVEDFGPDVIHVWGTEMFYGLIGGRVSVPVLIRFQGLLHAIKDDYWGNVKWTQRLSMLDEALSYIDIGNRAKNEIEIIKRNKYFEGRTNWDHSHLRAYNTGARYYDVPEMMRLPFYESAWSKERIRRHSVYTTARSMPAKGNGCLIEAIHILRQYVPDVQLRIGGHIRDTGYGRFLKKMVSDLGMEDCVTFLGRVSAGDIINELLNAHVYVLSSYIENSCNSLIEAQMVGVPCVASYVGGVTSLIADGHTGLFFNKGDSATLAMKIREVFENDILASQLSRNAREFSLNRYSKDRIIGGIVSAYTDIVETETCRPS